MNVEILKDAVVKGIRFLNFKSIVCRYTTQDRGDGKLIFSVIVQQDETNTEFFVDVELLLHCEIQINKGMRLLCHDGKKYAALKNCGSFVNNEDSDYVKYCLQYTFSDSSIQDFRSLISSGNHVRIETRTSFVDGLCHVLELGQGENTVCAYFTACIDKALSALKNTSDALTQL